MIQHKPCAISSETFHALVCRWIQKNICAHHKSVDQCPGCPHSDGKEQPLVNQWLLSIMIRTIQLHQTSPEKHPQELQLRLASQLENKTKSSIISKDSFIPGQSITMMPPKKCPSRLKSCVMYKTGFHWNSQSPKSCYQIFTMVLILQMGRRD